MNHETRESSRRARKRVHGPALVALAVLASAPAARDVGFEGPSFSTAGANKTPTESKPENKLWYNDGYWWGSLWSNSANAFHIHRLDFSTDTWIDTGVVVGGGGPNNDEIRPDSHSDCLVDGSLYIASHEFVTQGSNPGFDIYFSRYTYDTNNDTYGLDAGFPVVIGTVATEALTIDKDSQGKIWAAWNQDVDGIAPDNYRVHINYTLTSDSTWLTTPVVLPTNTNDLAKDDICALTQFRDVDGYNIGVLWSDQSDTVAPIDYRYRFSYHQDGASVTTWSTAETLPTDPAITKDADDHINLATHHPSRRLYVAGKNDEDEILLFVRTSTTSTPTWSRSVAWIDSSGSPPQFTRPIVVLKTTKVQQFPGGGQDVVEPHLFATWLPSMSETDPLRGGVYEKKPISYNPITFDLTTNGTLRLHDTDTPAQINNVTSTKQNITPGINMVVLASHSSTAFYWHYNDAP